MNRKGITLIELLVVISVIGILAIALGFSFQGWKGRYQVEGAAKTLYSDLMTARTLAMQRNSTYLAALTATSYQVARDANGNLGIDAGEAIPGYTAAKATGYTITGAPVTLAFSDRGIISTVAGGALQPIDPLTPLTLNLVSTSNPDYDCIVINATKIDLGKFSGGACGVQ
ncbi:MAG: GspH/FimT family pseudopilin [Acidobacteriota bacterium]